MPLAQTPSEHVVSLVELLLNIELWSPAPGLPSTSTFPPDRLRMRIARLAVFLAATFLAPSVAVRAMGAPPNTAAKEKHWAFQPIRRPEVPEAAGSNESRNPVDRFVVARLRAEGVKPVGAADRRTLVRRLYLDLIGLPPSPDEVSAFLEDRSPNAVERLVDDLLSRPQYGERWARHWLDVVRYAETNGYERDGTKPEAWRYRDYVISALNRDKPYDRFLLEQLAGDEVEDSNASAQIATTFLRLGTWDDEPAEPKVDRYDQLDDILGTAATAFLGITLRCARCHDHKFEPFSQVDYYRMLAVFEPLKRPQDGRTELVRPVGTDRELAAYRADVAKAEGLLAGAWERIESLVRPEISQLLAPAAAGAKADGKPLKLPAEAVKALQTEPGKRSESMRNLVWFFSQQLEDAARAIAPPEVKAALVPLDQRVAALKKARPEPPAHAYIWSEDGPKGPLTHVLKRGDPTRLGPAVEPGVPVVLASKQPDPPKPTSRSTGRRLWLGKWLTNPAHPLVARVIVNRIWQFHFGQGLVASSSDFGVMGDAPSHPELLDWLASEFVASGWQLKPLHRLIVLSRTYQQSAAFDARAAQLDANNVLLWHWRPRRLDAEVVRDAILAVSGGLNARMAGPSVYPTLPLEVLAGQSRPGEGWGKSDEREQCRRSVYVFAKRSLAVPELDLLDAPDSTSSCERRIVSTTGPQALTFLNGAFIQQQASHFAIRVRALAGPKPADQVAKAFSLALGRPPAPGESLAAIEFLAAQERQIKADADIEKAKLDAAQAGQRALEAFCLVVLNMNEFVYIQ
jgi:hypothetical protein